jgi:tetratricopeptide (TPR) repeat protein
MSFSSIKSIAIVLLFFILGFGIYSNTLEVPFHFDDTTRIQNNPKVRITEFTFNNLLEAAFNKKSSKNRPVGNVTFALNYYFHKYNRKGYHIVNIIIHILTGIFLFFFINTIVNLPLLKPKYDHPYLLAFFAALLWLTHPVQTQSVTYIVQRQNSLSAMFYVLSFWLYLKARLADTKQNSWLWYANSGLAWILALGCKQTAATLPFLVFLFEWYVFQNFSADWLKRNLIYFLLLVFLFGLVAFLYIGLNPIKRLSSIGDYSRHEFTILQRLLTQPRVVIYYLSLIFFPHPSRLNLDYDFALSYSLINPVTTLISLGAIIALVTLGFYLAKKERLISFCILWFFGNLVIESSVIPVAIIFEHRNYLPSMLVFLIPIIWVERNVKFDWLKIGLVCAVVGVFSIWTYQRNQVWENRISLWQDCVKKSPNKARPHNNLGQALADRGIVDKAIENYQRAIQINPNLAQAHNNLGMAFEEQGKTNEAIAHYLKSLQIKPNLAQAHINLGEALTKQARTDEAIAHYLAALQINPDLPEAHNNLGVAILNQGKAEQAINRFNQALRINPDYAEAHNNLGGIFLAQDKPEQAIDHYTQALRLSPQMAEAHNNIGIALMQTGKIEEAILRFRETLRIKPDFTLAADNLKRALAIQQALESEISRLQKLSKDDPNNAELHFQLANLYFRKGDQRQAIIHYEKTLQLDSKFIPAINNWALVNASKKEYTTALSLFLDVLNHWPDNAETHYNIACMYSRLNKIDESIKWLKKAVGKGYTNWDSIKSDSDLDNIRNSLDYKELIRGH